MCDSLDSCPTENKTQYTLTLVFTSGTDYWERLKRQPLRSRWKFIRRNPMAFHGWWLGWATRICSFSRLSHIAVMHNGVAIEVSVIGSTFWPMLRWAEELGSKIDTIVEITTEHPIDMLDLGTRKVNVKAWRSFLKLWTKGVFRYSEDCVDVSINALAQQKIEVPWWVTTPKGLLNFLVRNKKNASNITSTFCAPNGRANG